MTKINIDDIISANNVNSINPNVINGLNLYSYCNNNPVKKIVIPTVEGRSIGASQKVDFVECNNFINDFYRRHKYNNKCL